MDGPRDLRQAGAMTPAPYGEGPWAVRADLVDAHLEWTAHVAAPGAWWDGGQRLAFVRALWAALDDADPAPPWAPPAPPPGWPLPEAAHALAVRLARHAATTSAAWYRDVLAGLGGEPAAYVELVGLAATGAAVGAFGPALGLARPPLPGPSAGEPSRVAPATVPADANWVPVTPSAEDRAAVVAALTAAPAEDGMLWRLAAVQYVPLGDMTQLDWRRPGSPLDRRQLELVASRLSLARECFY
jgi:hypothetical protein